MTDNDDFKKVLVKQFTAFLDSLEESSNGLAINMMPGVLFSVETLSARSEAVNPQEYPSQ